MLQSISSFKKNVKTDRNFIFCVANITQYETALPLIDFIQTNYQAEVSIIVNNMQPSYTGNLPVIVQNDARRYQQVQIINKAQLNKLLFFLSLKQQLQKLVIYKGEKTLYFGFTEGGTIEWFLIGVLKKMGVKTTVIQWAITWKPDIYKRLKGHDKESFKAVIKQLKKIIHCAFAAALNLPYQKMRFSGDGPADHILTMGEFWSRQFKSTHPKKKHKFSTFGNPRFAHYKPINQKDNYILLTTGAGVSLYKDDAKARLKDFENIYEAAQEAGIKLIHKPHPRDPSYSDIASLARKYSNITVSMNDVVSLIGKAKALITVRSTTGLEALLLHTPVIIFDKGDQILGFDFAESGLATKVRNEIELTTLLKKGNFYLPNVNQIEHFISIDNLEGKFTEYISKSLANVSASV